MSSERLKAVLIVLSGAALALGILAAFVVFYPAGSYQPFTITNNSIILPNPPAGVSASSTASTTASSTATPTSSPTATIPTVSGTAFTNIPAGEFSSNYTYPYPLSWSEGHTTFSVTAASLANDELTLSLSITMGSTPDCVPVNVRLVADESGTLQPPDLPQGSTFVFPDTQSCNGTPGETYSESLLFTIPSSLAAPYFFTTGGASNTFFQVATTSPNGITITLPPTSG